MLIDWFTVGAQAINFLILVWLMKRFLYKPILNAISEREKKIAAELADADKKKTDAQRQEDDFKHKNEEFDQQRAALLKKATDDAQAERERLLDDARKAAATLSSKRLETMKNEEQHLQQAIRHRTQQEVFSIARKTLTDLATTSLEERAVDVFTRRLHTLDDQVKNDIRAALKAAPDPALVRSAFDLPVEQRASIQKALNETFSADIRVRFETAPDLVSGIELTTKGQKVAWSIADYLTSLENGVEELLKEQEKREAKPSDKNSQIAKRAYELYEQEGRKSGSAIQNWNQAEQEIRRGEAKAEPSTEAKPQPKPEAKVEPKPVAKVEPKPEVKPEPTLDAKTEPKSEAKTAPKPGAKVETKTEAKPESKPEAKTVPKPEAKVETKPEAKTEPKPEVKNEPQVEKASK